MTTRQRAGAVMVAVLLLVIAIATRSRDGAPPPVVADPATAVAIAIAPTGSGNEATCEPEPAVRGPIALPVMEAQPNPDTVADPIAREVPLLYGVRKERQLELLRWLERVPEDKIISAIPALAADRRRPLAERREQALAIIARLIAQLEAEEIAAPVMPDGFVAAQLVDDHLPSGEHGSDRGL